MSSPRLTLIVPDLALPMEPALEEHERYPHLERLIARGSWRCEYPATEASAAALRPWQRGLLAAAGLDTQAPVLASAPISASAEPASLVEADYHYFLHADLVHLVAGVERLELSALAAHELTANERAALHVSIADYVREEGYELTTAMDGMWLLRTARTLDLTTYCADFAMAVGMHSAMPRGPDAGALRRLLTELQMLLHTHPVNVAREARGLRTANGIWVWGAGTLPAQSRSPTARPLPYAPLPQAVGNDSFLQGLWQLFQHPKSEPKCEPRSEPRSELSVADGDELLGRCHARTIAVARVNELGALETQWIAPLARGLAAGRLGALELVLDGWLLKVERRALLRFWRRPRPLTEQRS